jgi:hypothetical protein
MNRTAMVVPVLVALSLGFAACGGDDGDKQLSKADLAKKANAICKKGLAKKQKIKMPADLRADPVAAATYFTAVAPLAEDVTNQLDDLKPADNIKAAWTQFLARQKQGNATLVVLRDKAKAKDESGLKDLDKLGRIADKLTVEAAAVGANSCG